MMTSSRPRDVGGSLHSPGPSRRGHHSQLSISDPSHHVTEAIGTMYGDDDDSGNESHRPLSFIASPYGGEQLDKKLQLQKQQEFSEDRLKLARSQSDGPVSVTTTSSVNGSRGGNSGTETGSLKKTHTLPSRRPSQKQRNGSVGTDSAPLSPISPLSPLSSSLRDVQADSSGSQFPMSNMDNPNDIAQELSNLQALRRMSMDVGNNSDPDLLPFSSMSLMAIPSIAPKGDDDEADPSRLLWVPANVHPELEPTAFKDFLEKRVQSMKRRSGESMLSMEGGLERSNTGSLRRKKSMLSRRIDNDEADGYVDGAERLERKLSLSGLPSPELSLDELVKDPSKAVQKLAQESRSEGGSDSDMPILPVAPGMGLRRSTRTTYRKGGSLRGDRVPFSKRMAAARNEKDGEDKTPAVPSMDRSTPSSGLQRVQSESAIAENYSRPTRSVRRQQGFSRDTMPASPGEGTIQDSLPSPTTSDTASATSGLPANGAFPPPRSDSAHAQRASAPAIPQIVETPPSEDAAQSSRAYPTRSSSQSQSHQSSMSSKNEPQHPNEPPARSSKRPIPGRQTAPLSGQQLVSAQSLPAENNSLNDMANHPSPLPGGGASRTDSLTFIPTFSTPEDKRADRKSRDKDDNESLASNKSSSGWKWFKDKKKREKEEEKEDREDLARKAKNKEKGHDNVRLDVLQNSIDNGSGRGRESLVLDRDSADNKLHEERKKDANRKSTEGKKEKDSFFGGLFGGSKKKGDKETHGKKKDLRPTTPEPPPRVLVPDVDYGWTRFPIIEERAIYRMAHLKLANPRRSLQSQVLLSNFMYSYLAKVQAMHPHIQVPISPHQKKAEEERKRREAEQAQLKMEQQMAEREATQDGNFNFEYHRSGSSYGESSAQFGESSGSNDGSVQYMDEAAMYAYQHDDESNGGSSSRTNGGGAAYPGPEYQGRSSGHDYYFNGSSYGDDDDDEDLRDEMW